MSNLFKNPFKKRGLPDRGYHDGKTQQEKTNVTSTLFPISSSTPPSSTLFPSTNPSHNNNYPPVIGQPIAYPYAAQPDQGQTPGAVWELNTGENKNTKGRQIGGNIKAANTIGSAPAMNLPQNGRFVFNTGKNNNDGDHQENGNIEFGNRG